MFSRRGFTLVELMIAVAIVGILAAIAIPSYVSAQYRAKRSEVPLNIDGIKTAEIAYDATFDTFVQQLAYVPHSTPSKHQRPWLTGTDFDTLGWAPDGDVRGAYRVETLSAMDFRVVGIADIDGDLLHSRYTAQLTINPTMTTAEDMY